MAFGNRFQRWIYNHSPASLQNTITTIYSRGRTRKKYGTRFTEYLTDLERTQWYSNDELQALEDEKLRRIIWYASRHVPYYVSLFREVGIDPRSIKTKADLSCLPILEKKTVQSRMGDFRSSLYLNARTVECFQSSGTTGRALDIYVTPDCLQFAKAITWLHRSWAGIAQGNSCAYFVGFPVVPVTRKRPPFWVHDRVEDRMIFSLQHMNATNFPAYTEQLIKFQPRFIEGYPTAIYLMALYIHDARVDSIRPKAVFTASETLLPHQRQVIEQAFACRVFDFYGSVEFVANIVQCEYGNYHIKSEYGAVEILNRDGSPTACGNVGELVCTGLNNLAMPLIRYRTGDTAIPKDGLCPCKRGGRLVERIVGRIEDVIVTPDRRYLSRLDFVFKGLLNVSEAQILQDARDHLRVRVVPRGNYSSSDEEQILRNLRERIGTDMRMEIEKIDAIPRTASGKFRYVISQIPLNLPSARQTGEVLGLAQEEKELI